MIKQVAGGLDAVFVEEVRCHIGVDAAHAYGDFLAHVTAWWEHHQIPYKAVPVRTIKRQASTRNRPDTSKQKNVLPIPRSAKTMFMEPSVRPRAYRF